MWNAKTLIVLANAAIALGGFISYWKWENFGAFKKDWHDNSFCGIFKSRPVSTGALLFLFILCLLNAGISIRSIANKENLIHFLKMPTRARLEQIMGEHRKIQYEGIANSNALAPLKLIQAIEPFDGMSDEQIVREISGFCLAQGGKFPNSHLFLDMTSPELGVSLECWKEDYEDTDVNGMQVDNKLDSKIGKFVIDCVSKWYNIYKIQSEQMDDEAEKKQHAIQLIPRAIENVYKIKIPQEFDRQLINEFSHMRKAYIVQKKINKYIAVEI